MGNEVMYRGPYTLLMVLPGFNALRVPARFWMMTTLCLAVVGAIIFDRLTARYGRNRMVDDCHRHDRSVGGHMDDRDASCSKLRGRLPRSTAPQVRAAR